MRTLLQLLAGLGVGAALTGGLGCSGGGGWSCPDPARFSLLPYTVVEAERAFLVDGTVTLGSETASVRYVRDGVAYEVDLEVTGGQLLDEQGYPVWLGGGDTGG